jgi:hypothetical protein
LPGDTLRAGGTRTYSCAPWLVANLTLVTLADRAQAGASMAWDNVLYDSRRPGLRGGDAPADAGAAGSHGTYLLSRPESDMTPQQGRAACCWKCLARSGPSRSLPICERAHPDIRQVTTRLDVFRNAHAMARPLPGLIWGEARRLFAADGVRLRFAHADVSGFSLFEEAQYRGVLAAERTMRRLGVQFVSSLLQ